MLLNLIMYLYNLVPRLPSHIGEPGDEASICTCTVYCFPVHVCILVKEPTTTQKLGLLLIIHDVVCLSVLWTPKLPDFDVI